MSQRRARVLALMVLSATTVNACLDTPALPRVRVRVERLGGTRATVFGHNTEVDVFFTRADDAGAGSRDASAGRDGGSESNVVARGILWDGRDPFSFPVQIPGGTYGRVRIEVHATLTDCPSGPRDVVIAEGQSSAPLVVGEGSEPEVAIPVSAVTYGCL